MKHINIAVFPCGSEVGLEIYRSLKDSYFITLFGISSVPDHGEFVYENYIGNIPLITDSNFISEFNKILEKYEIDYIFPAMDSVYYHLSKNRDKLKSKLLASSVESVENSTNKSKTYQVLSGCDFLPKIYSSPSEVEEYPIIIKPSVGYGSKGVLLVHNIEQLEYELSIREEEHVICEYLSGEEYTVDCFTDRNGTLRYSASRARKRVKSGISVNSILQPYNEDIKNIAEKINSLIPMQGCWFFQLKNNCNGNPKLLEVAPRIAGTMCVQRAAGVNLPLLTIYDAMGHDVEITQQLYSLEVDRALSNKYRLPYRFDELYIDFDDTLIINNKVNLDAMYLIYQCINQSIPIYLISKHAYNLNESLSKYKISADLFDRIIHISTDKKKFKNINPSKNALFIDDSFAERKEMYDNWKILCMGADAIETFLDYK